MIFVTAHDQYAVKAFDAHAIDYLLKPLSHPRFQEALKRVREQLRDESQLERGQNRLLEVLDSRNSRSTESGHHAANRGTYLQRFVVKNEADFFC